MANGSIHVCNNSEHGGVLIPLVSDIVGLCLDVLTVKKNHRQIVLVVEKEATFAGIVGEIYGNGAESGNDIEKDYTAQDRIGQDWIIITGKGYPDKNTHAFVNLLSRAKFKKYPAVQGQSGKFWWSVTSLPLYTPSISGQNNVPDTEAFTNIIPLVQNMIVDFENINDEIMSNGSSESDDSDDGWMMKPAAVKVALVLNDCSTVVPEIFGLFDCDPYGIEILLTYAFGSQRNAYDSPHLATPGIKHVGIIASDISLHINGNDSGSDSNSSSLIRMTERDRKKARQLLVSRKQDLTALVGCNGLAELSRMLFVGYKVEIQGLSVEFLVNEYLREKLYEV
ncbi:hypothetical protein HK100_011566 [Physocladia obscura]|uniref:Topoisomerase 6 subunit A/Spo11 TOPRIM domain-containing protein n=1 Tax=Physocladia obscura TaxID=109957 RepID=A0AAD5TA61_9FUNG|nr:hypothetical protein HK100_011566 [Physocladia obscura]